MSEKRVRCPECGTKLRIAPGVGPYCPNRACDVVDDIDQRSWITLTAARAEARPAPVVDREAVITAIGEAVTYLDWHGAELAADAALALLSPATSPGEGEGRPDDAGGGG